MGCSKSKEKEIHDPEQRNEQQPQQKNAYIKEKRILSKEKTKINSIHPSQIGETEVGTQGKATTRTNEIENKADIQVYQKKSSIVSLDAGKKKKRRIQFKIDGEIQNNDEEEDNCKVGEMDNQIISGGKKDDFNLNNNIIQISHNHKNSHQHQKSIDNQNEIGLGGLQKQMKEGRQKSRSSSALDGSSLKDVKKMGSSIQRRQKNSQGSSVSERKQSYSHQSSLPKNHQNSQDVNIASHSKTSSLGIELKETQQNYQQSQFFNHQQQDIKIEDQLQNNSSQIYQVFNQINENSQRNKELSQQGIDQTQLNNITTVKSLNSLSDDQNNLDKLPTITSHVMDNQNIKKCEQQKEFFVDRCPELSSRGSILSENNISQHNKEDLQTDKDANLSLEISQETIKGDKDHENIEKVNSASVQNLNNKYQNQSNDNNSKTICISDEKQSYQICQENQDIVIDKLTKDQNQISQNEEFQSQRQIKMVDNQQLVDQQLNEMINKQITLKADYVDENQEKQEQINRYMNEDESQQMQLVDQYLMKNIQQPKQYNNSYLNTIEENAKESSILLESEEGINDLSIGRDQNIQQNELEITSIKIISQNEYELQSQQKKKKIISPKNQASKMSHFFNHRKSISLSMESLDSKNSQKASYQQNKLNFTSTGSLDNIQEQQGQIQFNNTRLSEASSQQKLESNSMKSSQIQQEEEYRQQESIEDSTFKQLLQKQGSFKKEIERQLSKDELKQKQAEIQMLNMNKKVIMGYGTQKDNQISFTNYKNQNQQTQILFENSIKQIDELIQEVVNKSITNSLSQSAQNSINSEDTNNYRENTINTNRQIEFIQHNPTNINILENNHLNRCLTQENISYLCQKLEDLKIQQDLQDQQSTQHDDIQFDNEKNSIIQNIPSIKQIRTLSASPKSIQQNDENLSQIDNKELQQSNSNFSSKFNENNEEMQENILKSQKNKSLTMEELKNDLSTNENPNQEQITLGSLQSLKQKQNSNDFTNKQQHFQQKGSKNLEEFSQKSQPDQFIQCLDEKCTQTQNCKLDLEVKKQQQSNNLEKQDPLSKQNQIQLNSVNSQHSIFSQTNEKDTKDSFSLISHQKVTQICSNQQLNVQQYQNLKSSTSLKALASQMQKGPSQQNVSYSSQQIEQQYSSVSIVIPSKNSVNEQQQSNKIIEDLNLTKLLQSMQSIEQGISIALPEKIISVNQKQITKIFQSFIKSSQTSFIDENFPPNEKSFTSNPKKFQRATGLNWKRIKEFKESVKKHSDISLFGQFNQIEVKDTVQGWLANCYFVASLTCIAQYPTLVRRLFNSIENDLQNNTNLNQQKANKSLLEKQYEINGFYSINMCIDGQWQTTQLDDHLPYRKNDSDPIFCKFSSETKAYWTSLLEKAYAKFKGNYSNIEGGKNKNGSSDAIIDMTGAPSKHIRFQNHTKEDIWKMIHEGKQKGYLFTTMLKDEVEANQMSLSQNQNGNPDSLANKNGLISNHAYSILATDEIDEIRILKLKNPWGKTEWNGKWSDQCTHTWTDKLKEKYKLEVANDGIFWMSFCDYFDNFGSFCISYVNLDYYYSSLNFENDQTSEKQIITYTINECEKHTQGYFIIYQNREHLVEEYEKNQYVNHLAKILEMSHDGQEVIKQVAQIFISTTKFAFTEISFEPKKTYKIVIVTEKPSNVVIAFYTSNLIPLSKQFLEMNCSNEILIKQAKLLSKKEKIDPHYQVYWISFFCEQDHIVEIVNETTDKIYNQSIQFQLNNLKTDPQLQDKEYNQIQVQPLSIVRYIFKRIDNKLPVSLCYSKYDPEFTNI